MRGWWQVREGRETVEDAYNPVVRVVTHVSLTATFIPISYGWAAGDVSLAAYIQASLARLESTIPDFSALSAVMSFLYCVYVVMYAVANPMLGRYVDRVWRQSGQKDLRDAIYNIAGVHFTVLCTIMLLATLIPQVSS